MKLFFILVSFLVIYCDDSGDISAQEADKEVIDNLKIEIKNLANASVCSDEYTCYSVGMGAKPCGGFWEYIVYSGSIDLDSFFAKIETLNVLEKEYNDEYQIQSDCFVAAAPSSIDCIEGKCTAVYD